MDEPSENSLHFDRKRFTAELPPHYLYTTTHFWLLEEQPDCWRVGLTSFATRMLGEIVEFDFEASEGAAIKDGQRIGWIEGFKALSDLHAVADGTFAGANSIAIRNSDLICADPYGEGWLYKIKGKVNNPFLDVHAYIGHLDLMIVTMQGGTEPDSCNLQGLKWPNHNIL